MRMRGRHGTSWLGQGAGWWLSTKYYAQDIGGGLAKAPAYIADFRKDRYARSGLIGEKLTNGSFDSGMTGWTNPNGTAVVTAGSVTVTSTDGLASGRIAQTITCIVGATYSVTVTGQAGTSNPRLVVNVNSSPIGALLAETFPPGTITRTFVATATTMWIMGWTNSSIAGTTAIFDSFSVKEVKEIEACLFSDIFRFTRPGTATYIDEAGNLKTAANDEPRFDYATNGLRQLLLEGPGTNLIPNSTNPATWSLIAFAGITPALVNSGILPNGMEFADVDFIGTPSTTVGGSIITFNLAASVPATDNETLTGSCYVQLLSGTLPISNGAGGLRLEAVPSGTSTVIVPNATLRRLVTTFAMPVGTTSVKLAFRIGVTVGEPVNVRVRFAMPQLERQLFASSVIRTAGSAVTRAADSCRLTEDARACLAGTAASALVQAEAGNKPNPTNTGIELGGATGADRVLGVTGTGTAYLLAGSGITLANVTLPLSAHGACGAWDPANKAGSYNGAAVVTSPTPIDTVLTDAFLGRNGGGNNFMNSWYDSLTIWPFRIANASLPAKAIPYAA